MILSFLKPNPQSLGFFPGWEDGDLTTTEWAGGSREWHCQVLRSASSPRMLALRLKLSINLLHPPLQSDADQSQSDSVSPIGVKGLQDTEEFEPMDPDVVVS